MKKLIGFSILCFIMLLSFPPSSFASIDHEDTELIVDVQHDHEIVSPAYLDVERTMDLIQHPTPQVAQREHELVSTMSFTSISRNDRYRCSYTSSTTTKTSDLLLYWQYPFRQC